MFHRQCVVDQNYGRLLWTWLRKQHVQDQGTPSLTFIAKNETTSKGTFQKLLSDFFPLRGGGVPPLSVKGFWAG